LLWKWIAASSSEKGNKNYSLSAKIVSYGPKSHRMETSPANSPFFIFLGDLKDYRTGKLLLGYL